MDEIPAVGPAPRDDREGSGDGPAAAAVVVVIEDEPQIRRFLRPTLVSQGYRIVEAATGEEGVLQAATRQPDLVILDLGLPDMDGLEVIRRLREWTAVPIIVLSARGQERDKIAALDAGADDYVAKPFAVGELLARMRVALRHAARSAREATDSTFAVGNIRVDLGRRRVFVGDAEVHLTRTEYKLFTALIRHAGNVLTHRSSCRMYGARPTPTRRTTSGSTWASCAINSRRTQPAPASYSRSQVSGTDWLKSDRRAGKRLTVRGQCRDLVRGGFRRRVP